MDTVDDRPALTDLEREALHIAAAAPAPELGPESDPGSTGPLPAPVTGPSEEEVLAGYQLVCTELIDSGCAAMLPAWQVTPREVSKLGTACAKALMLWFPDMIIPPKYLALLTIVGVGFEIAQARKDPDTGRYRPARVPENNGTDIQGRSEPAPVSAH